MTIYVVKEEHLVHLEFHLEVKDN
uniref:Uncharacterized protein n=1 Tax=Anguilla anguilla TaxID=7936 RepID=A0A0E9R3C4_ANGAN